MRHNKKFNHLSRQSGHRKAMLANMASSLIMHKRIETTLAKAKALRVYVEPLITKSKDDTTHSRRIVFQNLSNKAAVKELFQEISQKIGDRPGGYTRIIKTGNRLGDNASTCFIELVDYNELMLKEKSAKAKSTRRSRRGGGKGSASATAEVMESTPKTPKKEPKAKIEEPKAEKPVSVEPVMDTPVAEETVVEIPVVETPVDETPTVEVTVEEVPAVEESVTEVQAEETPAETETPTAENKE